MGERERGREGGREGAESGQRRVGERERGREGDGEMVMGDGDVLVASKINA